LAGAGFQIAAERRGPLATVRDAGRRRLPVRYRADLWDRRFRARLNALIKPGDAVLDVGAGRRPMIPVHERPEGLHYVGLDPDRAELELAAAGSYDEYVVSTAEEPVAALDGRFDLVLSFLALEHVHSTAAAMDNMRAYLKPGGWLIAQLAGVNSPFSIANRLLPERVSKAILARTQEREPGTVFRAHYDRGSYSELVELLDGWSRGEVLPLFIGVGYVLFSRTLTAAYIAYEEWTYRTGRRDLAAHYLVCAQK
jgi:SAM-dependent methyltransferase